MPLAGIPLEVSQAVAAAGDLYLWGIHKMAEMIATLPDEIELIWPTKMSLVKIVYLVNKYSVLFDIACDTYFKLLTYWYLTATLFSEFILLARSWALWACDRYMLYNTIFIACMMVPHAYYVAYDMLRTNTANFAASSLVVQLFGCMPAIDDQAVWPAFTYLICAETMIVLITLLKRYVDRSWLNGQQSYSNLMLRTLYRDGTCFWAIVLAFSAINMTMLFCAPRELSYSMQMGLRTVHSALCTRVLLNLRKVAARTAPTRQGEELDFLTTLALEPLPDYSETEESDDSMPRTEDFELHDVSRQTGKWERPSLATRKPPHDRQILLPSRPVPRGLRRLFGQASRRIDKAIIPRIVGPMATTDPAVLADILPGLGSLYLYQINKVLEIVSTLLDEVHLLVLVNKYSPLLDFTFIILDCYLAGTLVSELVVVLTVLKRYVDPASVEGSFASVVLPTMYRDAFSVINFLMMFFAPRELSYSMQMPLRVVHSALCTRVLLNLRKAAARVSRTDVGDFTIQTTVAFAHPAYMDIESRGEGPLSSYDLTELRHHE
ncbi:hypothetical protein LXA43DRAFT_974278 [Ganoderma leucocontextum]|nr:hypothetical protein LXA43DRAFT_974278 [Ganoderma leucocontextum]